MRWGLRSLFFQQCLQMADSIICYSQYVQSLFAPLVGKFVDVIPNGVPPDFADATTGVPRRHAGLNLAYCGTVARHKGLHVILDALRAAGLASVNLLIIGDLADRASRDYAGVLRREAASIPGLTLRFYGRYERRELPVLLQNTDSIIVPSLVPEAGPIVPREALALGIPVIASNLGGLPELIDEGKNGFIFDPRRSAELTAILMRIASNERLRDHLREGARRTPVMTIKEHSERIRAVYEHARIGFDSRSEHRVDQSNFNALQKALVNFGCAPSAHPNYPGQKTAGYAARAEA